ncbi:MAG TPA: archaeoflavoprotein AfpA [Candidatus Deferrimicrobium sp.]|nr:archaeoflavoprotein AfpA [Candidatus Deferrimicrobium sp.]
MVKRLIWGITGSGDFIKEIVELILQIQNDFNIKITVILSQNGELVLKFYKILNKLKENVEDVKTEKGPNNPFLVGKMQTGYYDLIVISPVSGNTVAKVAYGIADSLISNGVAQALKGGQKIYLFPTDQERLDTTTILPSGKTFVLKHRKVDLDNIAKLQQMEDIFILKNYSDIYEIIKNSIQQKSE